MVECGGLRAASGNARFLLRKIFAMIFETNLQTPPLPAECGGFCSHTRRPPHSTLRADVCEEVDQNFGGFWQNLGDSWQNIASENATAFAKNNVKKS